ncbi:MAG: hypothetical protein KKD65_12850 [Gammaproteobacteria bacterium]|nr:hypothetical protein [Gammaproteobacteria bacterium]
MNKYYLKTVFNFRNLTVTSTGDRRLVEHDPDVDTMINFAAGMIQLGKAGKYDPNVHYAYPNDKLTKECVAKIEERISIDK